MAMTLETKLREIFASAVTAAGCIGYATSANERNSHKEAVANARKRFEDEIAHLSAQAKVQLPDDVEEVTTSLGDDAAYLRMQNDGESEIADNMERASNMIESLVNRLSQGAQGETVGEIRWMGNIPGSGMTEVLWKDGQEPPVGTKLYTHPAERAAVPDAATDEHVPRWWDDTHGDAYKEGWNDCRQSMLTAAPQPPEGARVVDEHAAFQAWWDERLKENRAWPLTPGEGYVAKLAWLERASLAAPTLAGKEG